MTIIYRLADGFYFDDHNSAGAQDGDVDITDAAKDQPELTLTAEMWAGASVGANLLVFNCTAGVNLVFGTHILFDLNDLPEPKNDGSSSITSTTCWRTNLTEVARR